MDVRISVTREAIPDKRLETARKNPHRRRAGDEHALDHRLESPLGRLAFYHKISPDEYNAGRRWQSIYIGYLASIGAPYPFPVGLEYEAATELSHLSDAMLEVQAPGVKLVRDRIELPDVDSVPDAVAERLKRAYEAGRKVLLAKGQRVFHAVNAVAVYEEPEELGDFEFTARAAKVGLAALVKLFS